MNGFLAALDNNATAPVNPSSTVGDVVWPSPFYVHTFTPAEAELQVRLFGNTSTRLSRFVKSIQLLWLVEDSVLSSYIRSTDPIITYDNAQLVGQFEGVSGDERLAIDEALAQLPFMRVDGVISNELRDVFDTALSPADRLAAVVVHFGSKYAA